MKNGVCIKCQNTKLTRLNTFDDGESARGDLKLVHHQDPSAWLFKGSTYFKMEAIACFVCGYVEFYLKPEELGNVGFI